MCSELGLDTPIQSGTIKIGEGAQEVNDETPKGDVARE